MYCECSYFLDSIGEASRGVRVRLILQNNPPATFEHSDGLLTPDARQVIQELSVQQTELEMQYQALHRAQVELAVARACYSDLFDLAPVGYVTLNGQGLLLQANLTHFVGVTRDVTARHQLEDKVHQMAFFDELTLTSQRDIFKRADAAMYQAKADGRNRVQFFMDASMLCGPAH